MNEENKDDLKPTLENIEDENKEKQSARCVLREKFLRAITSLVGNECTLHMYSNNNINGIFRGNDIEFETLLVDNLKTPFVEIPHSKIRSKELEMWKSETTEHTYGVEDSYQHIRLHRVFKIIKKIMKNL